METILQGDLYGKTYLITGATSGIGLAAAEQLARRGACILGVGRSPERCAAAERRLRATPGCPGAAYFLADLSLQSQVRALAEQVRAWLAEYEVRALDGLLNCAGTFTFWYALTAEGFETQWAVNHLGPFLLTTELLPQLAGARVLTVSSASHYGARIHWEDPQLRRRYDGLTAYGQSKLANVLFSAELDRRLRETGGRAFAADPGLVRTDIGLKGTPALVRWVWQRRRAGGISPEESARGIVYLLADEAVARSAQVYWKHGQALAPSRRAQDAAGARRLWQLSERMVGAGGSAGNSRTELELEARYASAD